ncbi:cytochrome b5 [Phialemonium atrogriseum]|uniref:Cytochrome b5 n=1 Tax=Phialemonium atrogriseum TaxID=1093897 RepID=A0AAJ0C9S0_9PEZI|nr:[Phialemonium atrogriseum] [Phialemonium atrogriseum]KAK1772775.1 cytochrome b5 [Phialemonium atrogriseum]
MAQSPPSVRQRKPQETPVEAPEPELRKVRKPGKKLDDEDAYSPYLDIFRVLTFLFLASCGLSYLVSGGETWSWGMKNPPKYLQTTWWKSQLRGPLYLTPTELAEFDGTDETKPLYLAINGTIYDVSANRRTYGPGGSYHFFAGCDASRAYVTGCFAEDRTVDMRGVEEMYLPLDDPEVDAHWSREELEQMRVAELESAHRRVHEALKHWVDFFSKSTKYQRVGYVKLPEGWLEHSPMRKLCDHAAKGRVKRKIPQKEGET